SPAVRHWSRRSAPPSTSGWAWCRDQAPPGSGPSQRCCNGDGGHTGLMQGMRAEVADSWHRSAAAGVAAEEVEAPITLPDDALRDYREAHPLSRVFPLLDDVLGQAARDCDAV